MTTETVYRHREDAIVASLPALTHATFLCACDCHCHGGLVCAGSVDLDRGDCDRDCRGTQSTIVCEPFIVRDLGEQLHRVEPGEDDR